MRIGTVVGGFIALIVAIAVILRATEQNVVVKKLIDDQALPTPEGVHQTNPYVPASEGPQPLAVTPEMEFKFDRMLVNSEDAHAFAVRNEGQAPLKLAAGPRTCKCTIGTAEMHEIAPGESTVVNLKWHPVTIAEMFEQTATIWTNDPKNSRIDFKVSGQVVPQVVINPENEWTLGAVVAGMPVNFTGYVVSMLDPQMKITSLKASHPAIQATERDMTQEEYTERLGVSGKVLDITLSPDIPVGPFRETLSLTTSATGEEMLMVFIVANRSGPYVMLGPGWQDSSQALTIKPFPADKGKTVHMSLFVNGLDQDLAFEPPRVEPPVIQVSIVPDPSFQKPGRRRYRLTIDAPAGMEPGRWHDQSAVNVTLKSDHPDSPEFTFKVALQAD